MVVQSRQAVDFVYMVTVYDRMPYTVPCVHSFDLRTSRQSHWRDVDYRVFVSIE